MFLYLFLATAIVTTPETEIVTPTTETSYLQEVISLFTTEQAPVETVAATTDVVAQEEAVVAKVTEPIIITNAIDDTMLKYKHWTGTYSPDVFTITINGTTVERGAQCTVPAETKNIDIVFNYSFMNGVRTGTKNISYQLHDNITQATMTFSWKEDHKVLIDNGTLLKVT